MQPLKGAVAQADGAVAKASCSHSGATLEEELRSLQNHHDSDSNSKEGCRVHPGPSMPGHCLLHCWIGSTQDRDAPKKLCQLSRFCSTVKDSLKWLECQVSQKRQLCHTHWTYSIAVGPVVGSAEIIQIVRKNLKIVFSLRLWAPWPPSLGHIWQLDILPFIQCPIAYLTSLHTGCVDHFRIFHMKLCQSPQEGPRRS